MIKENLRISIKEIKRILIELFFMIVLQFHGEFLMENKQCMVVLVIVSIDMNNFFGIPVILSKITLKEKQKK
jgi:hypothetical protein